LDRVVAETAEPAESAEAHDVRGQQLRSRTGDIRRDEGRLAAHRARDPAERRLELGHVSIGHHQHMLAAVHLDGVQDPDDLARLQSRRDRPERIGARRSVTDGQSTDRDRAQLGRRLSRRWRRW
jgi:hypothetical protein